MELIRNVVRPCNISVNPSGEMSSPATDYNTFVLTLNPQVTLTNKRKLTDDNVEHNATQRVKKQRTDSVVYSMKDDDNGQGNKVSTLLGNVHNIDHKEKEVKVREPQKDGVVLGVDSDYESDIEQVDSVSNELLPNENESNFTRPIEINGYRWKDGCLQLRFLFSSEDIQWVSIRDAKMDYPQQTATFIRDHYKSRSNNGQRDRICSRAKKVLRDIDRAVRRITRLYDFYLDDNDSIRTVRKAVRAKKKKPFNLQSNIFKYGIQVPRTVKQAYELDKKNGNNFWRDAIELEMSALYDLKCFEFKEKGFIPDSPYQKTNLRIIFDVKADTLRRKARLVAGGHLIDPLDHQVYSSTVKGISVRILHVIAHSQNLKALCGDISNAFVTATTPEQVYCIAGPEFGPKQGMTVIIKKALYGLATSAASFHNHLADTFRSMNFKPTRFDNDVWIRSNTAKDGYDYICTHVDDFVFSLKNHH